MFPSLADLRICLQVISVERTAGERVLFATAMALAVFLLAMSFLVAFVSMLYIPLPDDICDRLKLQFFEFLLRVSNEYFGSLVGCIFGPKIRNKLTRLLVAIPFFFKSAPPKLVTVKNELIDESRVRIYYPAKRRNNALILFTHGGGWSTMKPSYYDSLMYKLIKHLGVLIISIDYRLSPENPYPGPVKECEAVYHKIITEDYRRFGIDPTRICVMGDSAGGNLSTVIAQRQLRSRTTLPKCQVLIYPVIHPFDLKSPSYQLFYDQLSGTALLNPYVMARWYMLYLNIPATNRNIEKFLNNRHLRSEKKNSEGLQKLIGRELLPAAVLKNPYGHKKIDSNKAEPDEELCALFERHGFDADFAPILGDNLTGLSPAMIITAGYDILRDEGMLYAKRLQSFKVAVQLNHYPAAYHGIMHMPSSMQRKQIVDDIIEYLQNHL
ncbi:unnamed protein product [Anisakis simplex]|uniref:Arylacetamide deacetylase n=1 Tax=Anisakis simplex TaxID=6269 RepID=A0A0M3K009_ANISI|nr:unnamed protein product [Anisakis simplex]